MAISAIVYMLEMMNLRNDYYTEAYAVVDGAKELDTYSDEYDKKVENVQNRIKNIAAGQLDNRKKDIKRRICQSQGR